MFAIRLQVSAVNLFSLVIRDGQEAFILCSDPRPPLTYLGTKAARDVMLGRP